MTAHRLFLAASLAANGILLAALCVVLLRPTGLSGPSVASKPPTTSAARPLSPTASEARTNDRVGNTWAELNHVDPRILMNRLSAAGFPPRTVRLIVTQVIDASFQRRQARLADYDVEHPYWQNRDSQWADPKFGAAMMDLNAERHRILRQLFGPAAELPTDEINLALDRQRYGDLPLGKRAALADLHDDYSRRFANDLTPDQRRQLDQELRAAVAALLTPQELELRDLRTSLTAAYVRRHLNLDVTNISEDEYRLIYRLYEPVIQQGERFTPDTSRAERAAWQQQAEQLKMQLKSHLSPEGWAEIEFASDEHNREVLDLTSRLDLPATAAASVSAVRQQITAQANAIRSNAALAADQRAIQLAALAVEAENRIRETLGRRGLEGYRRSFASTWLQELNP